MRAHDPQFLEKRWRRVARAAGLRMHAFAEAGGFPIFCLVPRKTRPGPALYLSAGIHGDEAGATEGMIVWAERSGDFLGSAEICIFPCLNPWGLANNSRTNPKGKDLNRCYHNNRVPQVAAHRRVLAGRRFAVAAAMHEDYDAEGVYAYAIEPGPPFLGEKLIEAAGRIIPPDPRRRIEGNTARGGLIRRPVGPTTMLEHPEAFLLHFHHSERTFTLETPSEFALEQRAEAHAAALDSLAATLQSA